ncbi:MAG: TPM domain-containing protein [Kofleriaceae bacterium]
MTRRLRKYIDHDRVRAAVEAGERTTSGEIVVAVSPWFWGNVERVAKRAFDRLGVGRTRGHTGVLIFVCPRRRHATVLGDATIHAAAGQALWDGAAAEIEAGAKSGDLTAGVVRAIELVAAELAARFPRGPDDSNELPNEPIAG